MPSSIDPPKGFGSQPFCTYEPRSKEAWEKSGLHPDFIKSILDVATRYNVLILIRPNDPDYMSLMTERYSTKSMYTHAKTCSWGPMAGFVCFDPRFHKQSIESPDGMQFQMKSLAESFSHAKLHHRLTKVVPLRITDARLRELLKKRMIIVNAESYSEERLEVVGFSPLPSFMPSAPTQNPQSGRSSHFVRSQFMQPALSSSSSSQDIGGMQKKFVLKKEGLLWRVKYEDASDASNIENVLKNIRRFVTQPVKLASFKAGVSTFSNWVTQMHRTGFIEPDDVLICVDPLNPYQDYDHRCATISDYDLFAFHPLMTYFAAQVSSVAPQRLDHDDQHGPIPPWILYPSSVKMYHGHVTPEEVAKRRETTLLTTPLAPTVSAASWDHSALCVTPPQTPTPQSRLQIERPPFQTEMMPSMSESDPVIPRHHSSHLPTSPSKALQGSLTRRERDLILELNTRVNYGGSYGADLRLFHHGPDSHNPHADKPDLPCIALIPCAMHSDQTGANCFRGVFIDTVQKLEDFYFWSVISAGYALFPGINQKWFDQAHPTPLSTEFGQVELPHRELLNRHLRFELELSNRHDEFLRISEQLWPRVSYVQSPQQIVCPACLSLNISDIPPEQSSASHHNRLCQNCGLTFRA